MTDIQQKIISLLKEDARRGFEEVAVLLGLDKKAAAKEIAALENAGVIAKYTALINENDINSQKVEALIEVKVSPLKTKGFDAIADEIVKFNEVKSLSLMSGAYDLMVIAEGDSLRAVANFVSEKLSTLEGVLSTATHFVLKKYKTEGVVLQGNQKEKRLLVQP